MDLFSGHVYNLRTTDAYYVANGIVTHNCEGGPRCRCWLDYSEGGDTLASSDSPTVAAQQEAGDYSPPELNLDGFDDVTAGSSKSYSAHVDHVEMIHKAGDAGALADWYEAGADGAIDWGSDGDWQQCVDIAGRFMDNPEGYCQLRHMAATGETTSQHASEDKVASGHGDFGKAAGGPGGAVLGQGGEDADVLGVDGGVGPGRVRSVPAPEQAASALSSVGIRGADGPDPRGADHRPRVPQSGPLVPPRAGLSPSALRQPGAHGASAERGERQARGGQADDVRGGSPVRRSGERLADLPDVSQGQGRGSKAAKGRGKNRKAREAEGAVPDEDVVKDFGLSGTPGPGGPVSFTSFDLAGPDGTRVPNNVRERPRKKPKKGKLAKGAGFASDILMNNPGRQGPSGANEQANAVWADVIAAGLAVRAEDTGRVLVIQRAIDDNDEDPAGGKLEFAGGHLEAGETPFEGACREWSEEIGDDVPTHGRVVGMWTSADGIYQGFVMSVPSEDDVAINLDEPLVDNPDAAVAAKPETALWMEIDDLINNPAVRAELTASGPWAELRTPAVARAMLDKLTVHYGPALDIDQRCGTCSMFLPEGACTLVEGRIEADATCVRWEPLVAYHGVTDVSKMAPGMIVTDDVDWGAVVDPAIFGDALGLVAITGFPKGAGGVVRVPAGTPLRVVKVDGRVVHVVAKDYNPDQPRDDHGRFASGGGGGDSGGRYVIGGGGERIRLADPKLSRMDELQNRPVTMGTMMHFVRQGQAYSREDRETLMAHDTHIMAAVQAASDEAGKVQGLIQLAGVVGGVLLGLAATAMAFPLLVAAGVGALAPLGTIVAGYIEGNRVGLGGASRHEDN